MISKIKQQINKDNLEKLNSLLQTLYKNDEILTLVKNKFEKEQNVLLVLFK